MKLLVDAILPETVVTEAPPGVDVRRWSHGDISDEDLLREGARQGVRAVVFFDRRSLYQPGLRELATQLGVALVAIDAAGPVEAKDRLFQNMDHLRNALMNSEAILVLAHQARST